MLTTLQQLRFFRLAIKRKLDQGIHFVAALMTYG